MRYRLDEFGLTPKLLLTCNPHKGWLYRTFFKPWRDGGLPKYRKFVPATLRDNRHTIESYIENLERLSEVDRQRLLFGNWEYDNDPARLIDRDKIENLFTNTFVPSGEKFITGDIAMMGSDLYVLMVWAGLRVIKTLFFKKIKAKEIEKHIKDTAEEYQVPRANIVFDSDGLGEFLGSYLEGAIAFHNGAAPLLRGNDAIKENYANLKTQCYFELAKCVQADRIFIDESDPEVKDKIATELGWVKRDKVDSDGKLFLLSKKEVKRGLGRSPDFADAMAMRMFFILDRERNRLTSGGGSGDAIPGKGEVYHPHTYYEDLSEY